MEDYRDNGKTILGKIFTIPKNIEIIERNIFLSLKSKVFDEKIEEYDKKIYEIIEYYRISQSTKNTLTYIKEDGMDFRHDVFNPIKKKEQEHDDFILNPFEVSEGVLECNKCGSKQTMSTSKQTRGGDESTTVFAMCVKCSATWKI